MKKIAILLVLSVLLVAGCSPAFAASNDCLVTATTPSLQSGTSYPCTLNENGELRTSGTFSGSITGADGAITDGVTNTIKATVNDYANSNPLAVSIKDNNGNSITSFGGGTQYNQGDAATSTDTMTMAGCVRVDTPAVAAGVIDGDRARCMVDSTGRLWVHVGVVDGTVSATQSGTWNIATLTSITNPVGSTQSGTWTVQPGNTANTTPWLMTINQGGNAATVNGSGQLAVNCANCSGSGVSQQDNTGFTPGTTNFVPMGGEVDDTGTTAVTENNAGVARITAQRAVHMNLRNNSGTEIGVAGAPIRTDPTGTTTQPVSASSLPLPTGAATLAEQQTQTTALQLIDNLPLAQGATTSGQSGVLAQGAVTTGAPSYTTGNTNPLSLQPDGSLRTAVTNSIGVSNFPTTASTSSVSVRCVNTAGNAFEACGGSSSGGTSSNFGSAVPSAGTAAGFSDGTNMVMGRVTTSAPGASDPGLVVRNISPNTATIGSAVPSSSAFVSGTDGTNARGLKTDTAGELQVDVLTLPNVTIGAAIPAGNNNIGDVDIASLPALPTGSNTIGNVNPGTAANWGVYVEDAAETAGANLSMAGSVRRDTAASSAGASGDNATINTDATGLLWARLADPCSALAKTYLPINISTATTTEITPSLAGASNHYYVCSINIGPVAGAQNLALVDDDTDNCASVTSGLAGGTTAGSGWNIAANGGLTMGNGLGSIARTGGTNRVLCLVSSAAVQTSGVITVVAAP